MYIVHCVHRRVHRRLCTQRYSGIFGPSYARRARMRRQLISTARVFENDENAFENEERLSFLLLFTRGEAGCRRSRNIAASRFLLEARRVVGVVATSSPLFPRSDETVQFTTRRRGFIPGQSYTCPFSCITTNTKINRA